MKENIIFGFREDGVLEIFSNLSEVRAQCPGIDVESGVWDFFDSKGRPLEPVFSTPNLYRWDFLGLFFKSKSSQDFDFKIVIDSSEPQLIDCLVDPILKQNPFFNDIADVKSYLLSVN